MTNLVKTFNTLKNPPSNADKNWFNNRGYKLEKIIYLMLERENLKPRASYKKKAEQIDGSFFFQGQCMIIEAKWHTKPIDISNLYPFKTKVDGKLIGTIGIFFSMSGYSKFAIDAMVFGKSLNIILFNLEDFEFSLRRKGNFTNILYLKLRKAAEEGFSFYEAASIEMKNGKSSLVLNDYLGNK